MSNNKDHKLSSYNMISLSSSHLLIFSSSHLLIFSSSHITYNSLSHSHSFSHTIRNLMMRLSFENERVCTPGNAAYNSPSYIAALFHVEESCNVACGSPQHSQNHRCICNLTCNHPETIHWFNKEWTVIFTNGR